MYFEQLFPSKMLYINYCLCIFIHQMHDMPAFSPITQRNICKFTICITLPTVQQCLLFTVTRTHTLQFFTLFCDEFPCFSFPLSTIHPQNRMLFHWRAQHDIHAATSANHPIFSLLFRLFFLVSLLFLVYIYNFRRPSVFIFLSNALICALCIVHNRYILP